MYVYLYGFQVDQMERSRNDAGRKRRVKNWDSEYRDLATATTGRDELLAMTKIENPSSEHRDHHRDQDTAMKAVELLQRATRPGGATTGRNDGRDDRNNI
ncbi:hypothetical protein ACOSP7_010254 [Xanthoceras sorbifolium]